MQRSCSTLIAMQAATKDGDIIFGKNSDRPVNESQPLEYFPAADHQEGERVKCTYISIPQVAHTNGYIGSRPYNIWGFEHGINDKGVIIGNEAVTGRETPELTWGLIGMDILRLGLERANTAREAVEIMGNLLETYGTGGDVNTRVQYFNANYIIADYEEAYIFESCQRLWAAKKITDPTSHIGNLYCLRDDYDIIGKDTIKQAVENGWCAQADKINIAETFGIGDCEYEDAEAYFRYVRQDDLMVDRDPFTVKMMMNNLRDHYDEHHRKINPYNEISSKPPTICCHPGGMTGCISAASVVCSLDKNAPDPLKYIYWGCMGAPCGSIYTPKFNIKYVPEELKIADGMYSDDSPWWTFTKLERYIALSYSTFAPMVQEKFQPMEDRFIAEVEEIKKNFDGDEAKLKAYSDKTFKEAWSAAKELIDAIEKKIPNTNLDYLFFEYFRDSSAGCGMQYPFDLK